MSVEKVLKAWEMLFKENAPGTKEFDHKLFEGVLHDLIELQAQQEQEQREEEDGIQALFDANSILPKLIILFRTNYSQIRYLCVQCMTRVIMHHVPFVFQSTTSMNQRESSAILSCIQILCDACVYEEKAKVRQELSHCTWKITQSYLMMRNDVNSAHHLVFVKCVATALAFTEDNYDDVVQFAVNEASELDHLREWSDSIIGKQVIDVCLSVVDRFNHSKHSIPLSNHELIMYIRTLCRLAEMNSTKHVLINQSNAVELLTRLNQISAIHDHYLIASLEILYSRLNRIMPLVSTLVEWVDGKPLNDILVQLDILETFDKSILAVKDIVVPDAEIEKLIQFMYGTFIPDHDLTEEKRARYKTSIEHLLSVLNHCMKGSTKLVGQVVNEVLFICCIFCSKNHSYSSERTETLAHSILDTLSNRDYEKILSKSVNFILKTLQPVYVSAGEELDPKWKTHPWAKHVLHWVIPQIHHPNLNGNILQTLLPMVLKMAHDYQEEDKKIGMQLLHHMFTECNRLQILAFDHYIFPVLRMSTGFRDNAELFNLTLQTLNLFLRLYTNYHSPSTTGKQPMTFTYKPCTEFVEEAAEQYLSCAEYSRSDEQRVVILCNMTEFMPIMSIGILKHMRRIVKILFSEDFLQNTKNARVLDAALSVCDLLIAIAWPVLKGYNTIERQHMMQVLGQIENNERAQHILDRMKRTIEQ